MTKMKRTIAVMVAAAGFVLGASAAQALPSISLVWQSPAGTTIGTPSVTASSVITADIILTGDSSGVSVTGVFISIEFDQGELQALGGTEFSVVKLPGMANTFTPLALGTNIDNVNGLVTAFDLQTLATGLNLAQSRTLGTVRFHVVDPGGSAADVDAIASLQNAGVDEISTSSGPGTAIFNGAAVTPEPTTALLVIAGLAGLGYAGRRSLR